MLPDAHGYKLHQVRVRVVRITERIGDRQHFYAQFGHLPPKGKPVRDVAAAAGHVIYDHCVEQAVPRIGKQTLEALAVGVGARTRLIDIALAIELYAVGCAVFFYGGELRRYRGLGLQGC